MRIEGEGAEEKALELSGTDVGLQSLKLHHGIKKPWILGVLFLLREEPKNKV